MKLDLDVHHHYIEGDVANGTVKDIDHFGFAEDGRTLVVLMELIDGRLCCYQFASGSPVGAHIVSIAPQ